MRQPSQSPRPRLQQPLVDRQALGSQAVAQTVGEDGQPLGELHAVTLELSRGIAPGADRGPEPRVVPPARVEGGVGVHDALALLERRRQRPLADDRVGVGEVFQQQRARATVGAPDAVAARQTTGGRVRRHLGVEHDLLAEDRPQRGVDVAARLLADQRRRPVAAGVAQAQPLDGGDERRARRLDGDLGHAAAVESAAGAQRLGETPGRQVLIERRGRRHP